MVVFSFCLGWLLFSRKVPVTGPAVHEQHSSLGFLLDNLSVRPNGNHASHLCTFSLCILTASGGALMLCINSTACLFQTPWGETNRITDMNAKLSFNKIVGKKRDSICGWSVFTAWASQLNWLEKKKKTKKKRERKKGLMHSCLASRARRFIWAPIEGQLKIQTPAETFLWKGRFYFLTQWNVCEQHTQALVTISSCERREWVEFVAK